MRYGSAMAVGIACAATGLKEATELLQPLLTDNVDYVRQVSLSSSAMWRFAILLASCLQGR